MRTPGTSWASPCPRYSRTISLCAPQHIHCCASLIFHLFSVRKRQIFPFRENNTVRAPRHICTKAWCWTQYEAGMLWDTAADPGAGKHSHSRKKGIFNPLVVLNALSIRSEKHKTFRCQKATLFSDEQHHIQRRTRCTAQNVTRIVLRVPGSVSGPRTSRRGLAGARRGNGGALGHSPEQRPGPRGAQAAFPLPRGGPERAGRAGRPPEKRRPPEVPPPGSEVTPRAPSPSRQRRRSRARLAAARGAAGRDHGGRRGPHRHLRRCGRGVQPGTGWRGSAPPPLAFLSFLARLRRRAACRALRAGPGRAAIVRPPRRRAFPPRRRALRGAGRNGTARGRASGPARGDSGPGRAGSGGARGREWVRERGREAGRGRAPSLPLSSPRRHSRPARESGPFPAAAGSAAIVRSAGGAAAAPRGGGRSAASCCRGECRPPALPALLGLLVSGGDSFA